MASRFLDTLTANWDDGDAYARRPDIKSVTETKEALRVLHYELDLPADERRRRVLQRFQAWLDLPAQEASRVARAFAAAIEELDPIEAECLQESEHNAVLDGMSYADFLRLSRLAPWLRGLLPQPAEASRGRSMPASLAAALALTPIL